MVKHFELLLNYCLRTAFLTQALNSLDINNELFGTFPFIIKYVACFIKSIHNNDQY